MPPQPPYWRPERPEAGGAAVLDFHSPYVLVDGSLDTDVTPGVTLAIRTLRPAAARDDEPETWSPWQDVPAGPVELGRPRFNGRDVSIHGVYRFQVRATVKGGNRALGLNAIRVALAFENGIMSIPQIFAGRNTVRFRLQDASRLRGPVKVAYRYRTAFGQKVHRQALAPAISGTTKQCTCWTHRG